MLVYNRQPNISPVKIQLHSVRTNSLQLSLRAAHFPWLQEANAINTAEREPVNLRAPDLPRWRLRAQLPQRPLSLLSHTACLFRNTASVRSSTCTQAKNTHPLFSASPTSRVQDRQGPCFNGTHLAIMFRFFSIIPLWHVQVVHTHIT